MSHGQAEENLLVAIALAQAFDTGDREGYEAIMRNTAPSTIISGLIDSLRLVVKAHQPASGQDITATLATLWSMSAPADLTPEQITGTDDW